VDTERELVNRGSLSTQIVDSNLGVGDTSIVSGLRERLVLAISVTSSGSSSHLVSLFYKDKTINKSINKWETANSSACYLNDFGVFLEQLTNAPILNASMTNCG
jgi:hypothetical protein